MKISTTLALIKSDYVRMSEFWEKKLRFLTAIKFTFMPSLFSIILYRFAHYFHCKNLKFLSWPLWALNTTITGADLMPGTVIGKSFFIGHPLGTVIAGRLGDNVVVYGQAAIGGGREGRGEKDVGGGPGLPCIKDNVIIGFRATILGPVVIGDGAKIGPNAFVSRPVPGGISVIGNPARRIKGKRKVSKAVTSPREAEQEV